MNEDFGTYFAYTAFAVLLVFLVWVIWTFLTEIGNDFRIREFKKNLEKSLKKGSVSWEDVKHLQSNSIITSEQCLNVLCKIKTDLIVTGDEHGMRDAIEDYISHLTAEEPFEGVSDKLKIHLIAVKDQVNGSESFSLLVKEIRRLIRSNNKEHKLLKLCTVGGFLFGLISILLPVFK